jgi:hypothetical protein
MSESSSDGSIDASFGPAEPDLFTQTVRKQQETEDSVISLFERHELFVKSKDHHMYVFGAFHHPISLKAPPEVNKP